MLSFRLLSNSMRGVSTLTSNHLGISFGAQLKPTTPNAANNQSDHVSKHDSVSRNNRTVSTSSVHCQAQRASKLSKSAPVELELDIAPKPKKPIIPWIMFVRDRKDEIVRQRGKISAAEMSVILAKEWQQVDRTPYELEYKRLHDEYTRQVKEYENSLTDEHRYIIDLQKEAKRDAKASKLLRKTNPPVMPRNPANFYCKERSRQDDVKERMKTQKISEVFSEIFKEYRSLSENEKKKYIDMQEEDKLRFQHEFLAWYEDVQTNENLTKAARDQANAMRDRLRTLNYI